MKFMGYLNQKFMGKEIPPFNRGFYKALIPS